MKCAEVIGLEKNTEVFCPNTGTKKIDSPEGPVYFCPQHFAEYRIQVEKTFNNIEQWAKDGVGW